MDKHLIAVYMDELEKIKNEIVKEIAPKEGAPNTEYEVGWAGGKAWIGGQSVGMLVKLWSKMRRDLELLESYEKIIEEALEKKKEEF